ncbi:hypothetical protein [Streptomyces alanosinicus]|uniref:hypothetical protein n=1 Tax=Streptomyces alanosinicus TaxID=68171 RepID=UPI0016736F30|nr:hypothetical protein [Streptomyces alanosinicus]
MDLEGTFVTVTYLIRDRDSKFTALFDRILAAAGAQTVLTGIRMPRRTQSWSAGSRPAATNFSTARTSGTSAD